MSVPECQLRYKELQQLYAERDAKIQAASTSHEIKSITESYYHTINTAINNIKWTCSYRDPEIIIMTGREPAMILLSTCPCHPDHILYESWTKRPPCA